MSEPKAKQSTEFIQKSWAELLRDEFWVQRVVDSPEFREQLKFTREELNNLRESVKKVQENDEQGKIEVLRRFIETKKSGKKFEVQAEAVQERSQMQRDALRWRVSSTEHKEPKKEPKLLESPIEWAKEHPVMAGGLALWTAFVGYKALSWIGGMFKSSESSSDKKEDPKEGVINMLLEKVGIKGDYAKWVKWFGVFGLVAAAGIGIFMGREKIGEYIGKIARYFGWESTEEKEAIKTVSEKFKVSEGLLRKIGDHKLQDILGEGYNSFFNSIRWGVSSVTPEALKSLLSTTGIADLKLTNPELEELSKLRDQILARKLEPESEATIKDFCLAEIGKPNTEKGHGLMWGKKEASPEYTPAHMPSVLASRIYQAYYGVWKPWKSMTPEQKAFVKGKFWDIIKTPIQSDFTLAQKDVKTLQARQNWLVSQARLSEKQIIEQIILEDRIAAIRKGPQAYAEYCETMKSTDNIIKRLDSLDQRLIDYEGRSAQMDQTKFTEYDRKRFRQAYIEFNDIQKDASWKIALLEKEFVTTTDAARKAAIQAEVTQLKTVVETQFKSFSKNYSKQLAEVLKYDKNYRQTLSSRFMEMFGREVTASDYKIRNAPSFFKMSAFKGTLVLSVVGMGFAAATAESGKRGDAAMSTGKRIGLGLIPLYGTYLDAKDAYYSAKKWDWWGFAGNSAAFVASAAWDVLLGIAAFGTLWFGAAPGVGLRSALVAGGRAISKGVLNMGWKKAAQIAIAEWSAAVATEVATTAATRAAAVAWAEVATETAAHQAAKSGAQKWLMRTAIAGWATALTIGVWRPLIGMAFGEKWASEVDMSKVDHKEFETFAEPLDSEAPPEWQHTENK